MTTGNTGFGIYSITYVDPFADPLPQEPLKIQNSTIANNSGGGINAHGMTLLGSTVSDNQGIGIWGGSEGVTIENSTISRNSASGVYLVGNKNVIVRNSLITGNTIAESQQIAGVAFQDSPPIVVNTIIADNLNTADNVQRDCSYIEYGTESPIAAGSGNNLVRNATWACGMTNSVNGNIIGVNPQLGPLANNGGDTQTHALLAGSPAINSGNSANCPATDQRGVTRPQGSACDIGPYEAQVTTPPPVDPYIGSGTLDAFNRANGALGGAWGGAVNAFVINNNSLAVAGAPVVAQAAPVVVSNIAETDQVPLADHIGGESNGKAPKAIIETDAASASASVDAMAGVAAGSAGAASAGGMIVWQSTTFAASQAACVKLVRIDTRAKAIGVVLKAQSTASNAAVLQVYFEPREHKVSIVATNDKGEASYQGSLNKVIFVNGDVLCASAAPSGKVQVYRKWGLDRLKNQRQVEVARGRRPCRDYRETGRDYAAG